MNKNIILKDTNENNLFPYNTSENIMINNLKLEDYLNIKFNEIKKIIYDNFTYKTYISFNNYDIVNTSTYEALTSINGTFNDKKNSEDNPFSLDSNNFVILNEKAQSNNNFTFTNFDIQIDSHGDANKFIKIEIFRNGSSIAESVKSVNVPNNKRAIISAQLVWKAQEGDQIKYQVYGTSGDFVSKATAYIETQLMFNNNLNDLI